MSNVTKPPTTFRGRNFTGIPSPTTPQQGVTGQPIAQEGDMGSKAKGLGLGLQGFGDFLSGMGDAGLSQQANQNNAANALASNMNQQQNIAQRGAEANQVANPAGSDVEPFAAMALKRALVNGFNPTSVQAPSMLDGYVGKVSGGMDMGSLKGTVNQFYSDPAIMSSMALQNKQRLNVDPYAPVSDQMTNMFGSTPETQGRMDDLGAFQKDAQARRGNYENPQQQALMAALNGSKKGPSKLASIVGGGLSFLGPLLMGL